MGGDRNQRKGRNPWVYGGLGAVGLVALAVAMPKAFPFLRGDPDAGIVVPDTPAVADVLIVVIAVFFLVLAVMLRLSVASISDPQAVRKRRPMWQQVIVLLVVFWSAALFASRFADRDEETPAPSGVTEGSPAPSDVGTTPRDRSRTLGLLLTVGLGAGVLGLGAAIYLLGRRDIERDQDPGDTSELLAAELALGIEELRATPDPRVAVIACYKRMENVLAAAGMEVRGSDTPFEILGRALARLEVPEESVRRLTDLFLRARFSQHPMDGSMRQEAVRALEAVRDSLASEEAGWARV